MPTEYFEARERALLGQRYETLYAAPSDSAARGVTVSALRTTPGTFAAKADMALEPSPFCKAAFVVREETFKPGRHPYHHAGVFYSQEPSAASAAPLLGVKPGMRVLDLCAAPGGKSSQLAAALQGQGLLVSNEYVAARADILKSNLERMGVPNAVILNEAPARIAEALPEFFDRVLVDAPCSGEGMFRKEAVAVTQHSEALVKQGAELGAQILDCAAVVHGGGVLLPVPFPQTTLHVLRAGVFVGSVQKGRFVPEHHLFTAFGAQCTNREELTLTDPRTVEYLSGREIEARTAADGWCCVTVDGWPLGGGKVSGGRVKNHYPKALRLL